MAADQVLVATPEQFAIQMELRNAIVRAGEAAAGTGLGEMEVLQFLNNTLMDVVVGIARMGYPNNDAGAKAYAEWLIAFKFERNAKLADAPAFDLSRLAPAGQA